MPNQLIQLTQRQLDNDMAKKYGEGMKRGSVLALEQILERSDPDVAFEAIQGFMGTAKWKVVAYEARKSQAKNDGAAKG